MDYIVVAIQFLNLITTLITIVIGIKLLKWLKENKILLIIPILSLLQIIYVEIIKIIFRSSITSSKSSITITNIYIYLEYLSIIIFFWKLKKTAKEKVFILISIPVAVISIFINYNIKSNQNVIFNDTFLLIEGPIILTLALNNLINSLSIKSITNLIKEPNMFATLGIFLSFLILWPSNILLNYVLKNPNLFFDFFFISNSVAYLIFFSFLTLSFYGTRKSGIN